MMNYLTYKFLPVAKTFWQLFDRHVLAHAKSPAKDFFEAFSSNKGANALLNYLDDLPEDLKEFFRDIQGEIVSAKFADKVDSNVPIRTLFVLRFLSPDIRTLVTLENSTDDNMAILKGLNFIKVITTSSKYINNINLCLYRIYFMSLVRVNMKEFRHSKAYQRT